MHFRYRFATIWGWVPNRENSRRERTKLRLDKGYFTLVPSVPERVFVCARAVAAVIIRREAIAVCVIIVGYKLGSGFVIYRNYVTENVSFVP